MKSHPIYEVLEEIGRGARATVYRARDLALKRYVAIKELHERFKADPVRLEQFWEEAQFLANLKHDNIVQLHALDKERGWIVMELMQGSLETKLAEGALPADLVRSVLRQSLSALQALHEQRKFHGDVRPSNLLLSDKGRVKLSDSAGIALGGEMRRPTGSAKYLAPELLNPEFGNVGPSVDLYCLGFTALELLKGPHFDRLFRGVGTSGDAEVAWMRWHSSAADNLPSLKELMPGLPEDLARVLDRLLQKRVAERYASAADALRDLEDRPLVLVEPARAAPAKPVATAAPAGAAVQHVGAMPPRPPARVAPLATTQPRSGPPPKSRRKTVLLGGVAVMLLAALAGVFLWPTPTVSVSPVEVLVETTPPGASVTLNDVPQDKKTPGPFTLQPGDNAIKLALAGHEDKEIRIVVKDEKIGVFDPPKAEKPLGVIARAGGKVTEPVRVALKALETPPTSATARLTVTTEPPGATVYLNGKKQNKHSGSEFTVAVAATGESDIEIRVELAGYHPLTRHVKLSAGGNKEVVFELTRDSVTAATRKLKITSQPEGADIYINGQLQTGKTNGVFEVPNKPFQLKLVLKGYGTAEREVDPARPGTDPFVVDLPRLTAKITIVSEPSGAKIFVDKDQEPRGETDTTIEVPNQPFQLKLTKAGYKPATTQVDPAKVGGKVRIVLDAIPPVGAKILIATAPGGGKVYINGKEAGLAGQPFEVPATSFNLKIELPGYQTVEKTYDGSKLRDDLNFKLVKIAVANKASLVWKTAALDTWVSDIIATPNEKLIICGTINGRVTAFENVKADSLWSTDQSFGRWLACTPDSKSVICGDTAGNLVCLEAATGKQVWTRSPADTLGLRSLTMAPDGKSIIWISAKGFVGRTNPLTGLPASKDNFEVTNVGAAAIAANGKLAVVADDDTRDACVIDLQTVAVVRRIKGHTKQILRLLLPPTPKVTTFVSIDGKQMRAWDINTGFEIWSQSGLYHAAADISPDGRHLLASKGKTLYVYDMKSGQELWSQTFEDNALYALRFAPNGREFYASFEHEKSVMCWRLPKL